MVTPLILLSELKGVVNAKWTDTDAAANVRRVIESASAWLQQACERRFDEYLATVVFDAVPIPSGDINGYDLLLGRRELRSLTSIEIDGEAITTGYSPRPRNADALGNNAYRVIRLDTFGSQTWLSADDPWEAIEVTGTWGYGGSWVTTGATLAANMAIDATAFTSSSGTLVEIGQTLKIDSEYLRITDVSGTTVTVLRAVNGSSAAAHTSGVTIYEWSAEPLVKAQIERLVLWKLQQQQSPLAGQVVIADMSFPVSNDGVPKDVIVTCQQVGLTRPPSLGGG